MNLLITFLFGLTILIGTTIILVLKDNKKISQLSISIAFVVLILLIFLDLIPETLEHLEYIDIILYVLVGIIGLKVLDIFIPEHDHSEKEGHVFHIGLIACIALILHNVIEGMALYTSLQSNTSLGVLLGIGIGLHNIPMGMVIGSTLEDAKYSKLKIFLISLLVSLATFLGGLIIYFIGSVTDYALGIMLAVTLGMLIYIVFFELLDHVKHQDKKNNLIGFIIGALIFIISMMFHSH